MLKIPYWLAGGRYMGQLALVMVYDDFVSIYFDATLGELYVSIVSADALFFIECGAVSFDGDGLIFRSGCLRAHYAQ